MEGWWVSVEERGMMGIGGEEGVMSDGGGEGVVVLVELIQVRILN